MRPRVLVSATDGQAPQSGQLRTLDARRSHHLVRVLRLTEGAPLECFDGAGARFAATLERADAKACVVRLGARSEASAESPLRITLAQCISAADRMDWTIEKAVELGVHEIRPLLSAHSPQRLDAGRAKRRREHWQRLVEAACMQCGRDALPEVHEPCPLEHWLAGSVRPPGATSIALLPGAGKTLHELALDTGRAVELLVGPESGFTEREAGRAVDAGFHAVRLGPRILRTETAGLAALAAIQTLAGDFKT